MSRSALISASGHLAARLVERRRERDVHRQRPGDVGVAAPWIEHADLVRRRVDVAGEDVALGGLEADGAANDDVLAELRGRARRARPRARRPPAARASRPRRARAGRRRGTPRCWRPARSRSRPRPCRRTSRRDRSRPCPRSSRGRSASPPARCPSRAAALPPRRRRRRSRPSARLQSIIPAPVRSRSSLTVPRRSRPLGQGSWSSRRPSPARSSARAPRGLGSALCGRLGRRLGAGSAGAAQALPLRRGHLGRADLLLALGDRRRAITRVIRSHERIASSLPGMT